MSNDRELLGLAALAVNGGSWHPLTHDTPHGGPWNPLEDDGDALRLAVKLKMDIEHVYEYVDVSIYDLDIEDFAARVAEDSREDPYAATRRAIVRAAAKIGRSM